MSSCTCDVRPARREHSYGRSISGYAVYLSNVEDDTRFDPACPFHGDEGSAVVTIRAALFDEVTACASSTPPREEDQRA